MNLSRRSFLGRASSVAAFTTAPGAIVVASASPASAVDTLAVALEAGRHSEDPGLLAIGATLPAMIVRYEAAERAVVAAEAAALAADGPFPDALRVTPSHRLLGGFGWTCGPRETNILGHERAPERVEGGKFRVHVVATVASIDKSLVGLFGDTRELRKEAAQLRRIAAAFEARRERIRVECGIYPTAAERDAAAAVLIEAAERSAMISARTLAGLLVKSQVLGAVEAVHTTEARHAASVAADDLADATRDVLDPIPGAASALPTH